MTTTDTPRTDACPHCGANKVIYLFDCGTQVEFPDNRTERCHRQEVRIEREARQKAEAEVERLQMLLNRSIEIQEEMCTGCRCWHCDDLRMELESIKRTNDSINTPNTQKDDK